MDKVTRYSFETYFDYIQSIADSGDVQAILLKLADLHHNMDPERMDAISENERLSMQMRYAKACDMLFAAFGNLMGENQ